MTRLRDKFRCDDGVAMVIVMGVMATLLVLTSVVVSSSSLVGHSTTNDNLRKRAFEAAEAGMQATLYRLNMLAPEHESCIGGPTEAVQTPSGGTCDPYTESVGNGASFTSWTTARLISAESCAGLQVGSSSSIAERCITASGTVDGVTRRVQARIASYAMAPPFPTAGLTGLTSVLITQNAHVNGGTGSNGQVTVEENATTTFTNLGPSAPNVLVGNNGSSGPVARRTSYQGPFALAPVDPGNSATVNDNVRLTNAFATPRVAPYDSVTGSVTWDAVTRTLALGNNAAVTLGGGLYNFCNLTFANNSTISLAAGARAAIYIDSPERSGSGCPASSGTFTMANNTSFLNNSPPAAGSSYAHDPTALQLYVVGKTGTTITMRNNSTFYGTLYAPTSTVFMANNADSYGAVSANIIRLNENAIFHGDENATAINTNNSGVYFRTAWRECVAAPTSSDPASGC